MQKRYAKSFRTENIFRYRKNILITYILEAKARYDHLFKEEKGKIIIPSWAATFHDKLVDQALRQDRVCSANYPAKCCWVWMIIKAYQFFNSIKRNYPNLYSIYVPLSK